MTTITLDDAEINAALNNLVRHINNLQPAMDSIGEALVGLIQEQLGRGETPWGDPFEPLSAAYIDAVNTPTGVGLGRFSSGKAHDPGGRPQKMGG